MIVYTEGTGFMRHTVFKSGEEAPEADGGSSQDRPTSLQRQVLGVPELRQSPRQLEQQSDIGGFQVSIYRYIDT